MLRWFRKTYPSFDLQPLLLKPVCYVCCSSSSRPRPLRAAARAQLPFRRGGLGLRSADPHADAALTASWADSFPALAARVRDVLHAFLPQLAAPEPESPSALVFETASPRLSNPCLRPARGPPSLIFDPSEDGWQRDAARAVEDHRSDEFGVFCNVGLASWPFRSPCVPCCPYLPFSVACVPLCYWRPLGVHVGAVWMSVTTHPPPGSQRPRCRFR